MKTSKHIVLAFYFSFSVYYIFSQNGGAAINTTGAASDPSAMLDVSSTNQGILIPNVALVSTTDGTTISNPAKSLLIYNTGSSGLTPAGYYYNQGTTVAPNWVPLITNNVNTAAAWSLTGNTGTTAGTNFLGTTDAKDFVFKTNNTEWARITSGGNVGIGTTSPNALFHVYNSTSPRIRLETGSGGFSRLEFFENNLSKYQIGYNESGSDAKFGIFDNGAAAWAVTLTGGNVGIGTTSPEAKLHINQTVAGIPAIQVQHGDGTFMLFEEVGGTDIWQINRLASTNNMEFKNVASGNFIFSGGNIGIGTTNPTYKLDILAGQSPLRLQNTDGASYQGLKFEVGTKSARIVMTGESFGDANYGTGDLTLQTQSTGANIRFGTGNGGTNNMIITYDGNVGIGTTAPGAKLDVVGDAIIGATGAAYRNLTVRAGTYPNITQESDNYKWIQQFSGGGTGYNDLLWSFVDKNNAGNNVDNVLFLKDNGKVGIGTSSPTAALQLKAGTASVNTAPLKFTSGSLLTSPEAGAMEFDGTNLYITNSTPTRLTIATSSDIQNMSYNYSPDIGSANAYAITLSPSPSAYQNGQMFLFSTANANTGASTLNVNSLGIMPICKKGNTALASGDIKANQMVLVACYIGTNSLMDSYSESNTPNTYNLYGGSYIKMGQSFTSGSLPSALLTAKFYLKKSGSPTGYATAKLYTHSGSYGSSSIPTGTALATSDNFDVSTLTTSSQLITFTFSGANQYQMSANTNYIIDIEYSGGGSSNYICFGVDYSTSAPNHSGNLCGYNAGSWSALGGTDDGCFYVYGVAKLFQMLSQTGN